ncbi:MAG: zinc transporter ZntB [Betaproteobacteria bacterium]|nr:MAG: zinc transporter ZntB [Betaproteobacteria bacterium]
MTADSSIIFSLSLDGKGGAQPIEPESFGNASPAWMHLDFSVKQARAQLAQQGLSLHVIDTLTKEESRPYTVTVENGLMVILRGINRNAGADPEDMVSIRMWVEPNRMITVRQRPVLATHTVKEELDKGNGPTSMVELLLAIIEKLADGISVFVEDIEERLEAFEEIIDKERPSEIRSEISAVRRQVAAVRRYLAPQRDALESLHRLAGKFMESEQLFALREQADRMTRYVEDLDLVRERALVAQEELMNRIAQEQNARTYLLSVVAAIFLPITFISGLFGMNTAGLPGLEAESAFWIVSGVMAVVSAAIIIWLWLKKWF